MGINKYINILFKDRSLFIKKVRERLLDPHHTKWLTRPFMQNDLASIPADWQVGPPGYIGIGTSKAGTSWWHQLILDHPKVTENRLNSKELEYFTHFLYSGLTANDIAIYQQAFAAPSDSICGEFTPGYLRTPLVAEYIHDAAPGAKLIAILRNPVEQMQSAANQMMYTAKYYNLNGARKKVFYNSTVVPDAIAFNLVFPALQRYLKLFDRSQILILQYEKCAVSPRSEIKKTYDFLGIESEFVPPSLNKEINKVDYRVPRISSQHRQRIAEFYWEDVQSTASLFPEIDLSLWTDFCK